jgi:hypothetical protein
MEAVVEQELDLIEPQVAPLSSDDASAASPRQQLFQLLPPPPIPWNSRKKDYDARTPEDRACLRTYSLYQHAYASATSIDSFFSNAQQKSDEEKSELRAKYYPILAEAERKYLVALHVYRRSGAVDYVAKEKKPVELAIDGVKYTTPEDHFNLLFEDLQDSVIIWHKDRVHSPVNNRPGPVWQSVKPLKAFPAMLAAAGKFDTYVTPNEFDGWRKLSLLRALNAIYLDFDSHDVVMTQEEILQWRDETLAKIRERGWSEPTFSVLTGRGFHLYWKHHREFKNVLPRWQALIRHMRVVLGADPMSTDSCREMRMIGTRNSKVAGSFVVHGTQHAGVTYAFEHLYETICNPSKTQIRKDRHERALRTQEREIREDRAEAAADARKTGKKVKAECNALAWLLKVLDDLEKIADYWIEKTGRGVPEGMRMSMIEVQTAAVVWFRPASIDEEVLGFGKKLAPDFSDEEILRDTQTLRKRAKMFLEGELVEYKGKLGDARYKYSHQAIWKRLGEHIPEALYPQLEALLPPETVKANDKARRKAADAKRDRVKEGRYKSYRTQTSFKPEHALQYSVARQMHATGKSVTDIAKQVKVSRPTVYAWLKDSEQKV